MGTGAVYNRGRKIDVVELSTPPTLAGDWVRIRVAFAGLCGSDMHLYHGKMDARVPVPMVIGHEASGTVVEVGSAVESVKVGDRVVVRPVVACYACPACERGHYNLCHNFRLLGIDLPGCFQ
ncbi:MAG: alcohol dehydrogenase catalytic domain-containing protein, partial [Spirochaetaceae bacterium]|nr:alcohol dehydrogenase catalytic domain-containing protein [Spirochaetaceae bacterium]